MDKAKAKVLVPILMNSSLYNTLSQEEKLSLLLRLERDYPSLFVSSNEDNEDKEAM